MKAIEVGIDKQRAWVLSATFDGSRIVRGHWSAQRLDDGRIAVVCADGDPQREQRLLLRVLGDDGSVSERVLRTGKRFVYISTAVDAAGHLAIATETNVSPPIPTVEAAIVDLSSDNPSPVNWFPLDDRRGAMPEVIDTKSGFVAAWTRKDDLHIHARNLPRALAPADIGTASIARRPLFLNRTSDGAVGIVWNDPPSYRRVPSELSGFELLTELSARWCTVH